MTLSLLFTREVLEKRQGVIVQEQTIKATDNGFLLISLFYDNLHMWILFCECLYMVQDVGPRVH